MSVNSFVVTLTILLFNKKYKFCFFIQRTLLSVHQKCSFPHDVPNYIFTVYDENRVIGESYYRLITKNGDFIYLQTRGQLEVDYNSRAVTTFVCTNTVLSEDVGKKMIADMKKRFRIMVNNNSDVGEIPLSVIINLNRYFLNIFLFGS